MAQFVFKYYPHKHEVKGKEKGKKRGGDKDLKLLNAEGKIWINKEISISWYFVWQRNSCDVMATSLIECLLFTCHCLNTPLFIWLENLFICICNEYFEELSLREIFISFYQYWILLRVGMSVCQGRKWQKLLDSSFLLFASYSFLSPSCRHALWHYLILVCVVNRIKDSKSLFLLSFTYSFFACLFCRLMSLIFPVLCKLLHLLEGCKIRDGQFEIHSVSVFPYFRERIKITKTYTGECLVFDACVIEILWISSIFSS